MSSSVAHRQIAAGYLVAGITLCLGFYFGAKLEGEPANIFLSGFYFLAVLIVLKYTFRWGFLRGFAVRREDGSIALSNLLRNLVMAAIVWVLLGVLFAPFTMVAFKLAR